MSSHATIIAREGTEWSNSLPIDVETDVEFAVSGFSDSVASESNEEGDVTALRFDGPIAKARHPLVLCLEKTPVSPALTLYPADSGEPVVKTFDLIGY